jgi:hypothetical protein
MKKKFLFILLLTFTVAVLAVLYFKSRRYEVVISQQQIDGALVKRFPATKEFLWIFEVTYSNPQVILLEDADRIRIGLDASLNIKLNKELNSLGGSCTLIAGVRYEPSTQEFFLTDTQFERLDIQGVPQEYMERATKAANEAAKYFVENKPIYRLEAKDTKTAAAKLLLKGFKVRDQTVCVTLGL